MERPPERSLKSYVGLKTPFPSIQYLFMQLISIHYWCFLHPLMSFLPTLNNSNLGTHLGHSIIIFLFSELSLHSLHSIKLGRLEQAPAFSYSSYQSRAVWQLPHDTDMLFICHSSLLAFFFNQQNCRVVTIPPGQLAIAKAILSIFHSTAFAWLAPCL